MTKAERWTEYPEKSYQVRVDDWMQVCFGPAIASDKIERNHRFLEEALECVQCCGCTADEAHQLVDYVFGRKIGDLAQEIGGVLVTLAALCNAQNCQMQEAGEVELARVWTKVELIRAKQAAKPKHSPLPESRYDEQQTSQEDLICTHCGTRKLDVILCKLWQASRLLP
jgi:hypothetical protein